jgi:hypothetical protein
MSTDHSPAVSCSDSASSRVEGIALQVERELLLGFYDVSDSAKMVYQLNQSLTI